MPWERLATTMSAAVAAVAGIGALMIKIAKGTFQTLDGCKESNARCVELQLAPMKLKIDDVYEKLEEMDKSREASGEVLAKELRNIAHFMGKVEQFMEDRK